ncbi:TPA: hypothetical protein SB604_001770 [Yersinia enterocolitica]|nr:hypothetical protein [Yersinia enterocolitica]
MKWILIVAAVFLGSMFANGVYTAYSQLNRGVSLMEVAFTYNSMNPVSQYGYTLVLRNNPDLQGAVGRMNESFNSLKNASSE